MCTSKHLCAVVRNPIVVVADSEAGRLAVAVVFSCLMLFCCVGMSKLHALNEKHEAPGMPWVMVLMLARCATREAQADAYPTSMPRAQWYTDLCIGSVGSGPWLLCMSFRCAQQSLAGSRSQSIHWPSLSARQNLHLHLVVDSLPHMPFLLNGRFGFRGDVLGWWWSLGHHPPAEDCTECCKD